MEPKIIFEDDNFFVVDKPSGWISDSSNTTSNQPVFQKWISENFDFPINNFQFRNGIVHRLDKETSGILLVAKNESTFFELQRQFKERIVSKTYFALVHGSLEAESGVINETVGRLPWRRDRFGIIPDGRPAITEYKVISKHTAIDGTALTFLELSPKTGRTHQIRIHLKHLGHPIVADEFYAGRKTARHDRRWCPRLFLHAGEIEFLDPNTKQKIKFRSPLPDDLAAILKSI